MGERGIVEVAGGVYSFKIPLPYNFGAVNCYLLPDREVWWVVDPGLNDPSSRVIWRRELDVMGLRFTDIAGIIVTHLHPDHLGGAGWLQERSGAGVYMTETDFNLIRRFWEPGGEQIWAGGSQLVKHGTPPDMAAKIERIMSAYRNWLQPFPVIKALAGGEIIRIGRRAWEVLSTPGHSDGHICLYDRADGILMAGDHLLAETVPNVSSFPGCRPNPLKDYLNSLDLLAALPVNLVLPGHGEKFGHVRERIEELAGHHRKRLEYVRLSALEGRTAFEVCRRVFGSGLSLHETRFAMGQTLSYLNCLTQAGCLVESEEGVVIYRGR